MADDKKTLQFLLLGVRPYLEVLTLQRELVPQIQRGEHEEIVLICGHQPVITVGKRGGHDLVKVPLEQLETAGVHVYDVGRGGTTTFHSEQQLIVYPLLDLRTFRRDVHWYMRSLEECIIRTLGAFGIQGVQIPGKTGVWVETPGIRAINRKHGFIDGRDAKIASIGVKLSRWCSSHGLALNVNDCREGFSLIDACSFANLRVTSIEECLNVEVSPAQAVRPFIDSFCDIFKVKARIVNGTEPEQRPPEGGSLPSKVGAATS